MIDPLLILAEGGSHSSEAAESLSFSPFLAGAGMFVVLMSLLAITFLFSGLHQKGVEPSRAVAHRDRGAGHPGHHG